MRLSRNKLTDVYLKKRILKQDEEGNDVTSYSEEYEKLQMVVQPAGGKVNAAIYGARLPYVKTCRYQGDKLTPLENELDGICLNVPPTSHPDFEIKSIDQHSKHFNVTIEVIDGHGRNY